MNLNFNGRLFKAELDSNGGGTFTIMSEDLSLKDTDHEFGYDINLKEGDTFRIFEYQAFQVKFVYQYTEEQFVWKE